MAPTTRNERQPTLDRLAEIIDRHGANQSRWPAEDQEALGQLVSRSPHAQALVRAAEKLEKVLDTVRPPEVSAALAGKIIDAHNPERATRARPPRRSLDWIFRFGPAQSAAASAVAAALITIAATSYFQSDSAPPPLTLDPGTTVSEIPLDAAIDLASERAASETDDTEQSQIGLTEVSMVTLDDEPVDDVSQLLLD